MDFETPLMKASYIHTHTSVQTYMQSCIHKQSGENMDFETPLMKAAERGYENIVEILLQDRQSGDINEMDSAGASPNICRR